MKKLGIVITDGVGFRNYVMSDFITEALKQFDKIVIYSGLPESCYENFNNDAIEIKELPVFIEGKSTWFFRKWKELAHLQQNKVFFGMKNNLIAGYPKNNSLRSLLTKGLYFFTKYINSNSSILFAEKLQFLSFSKKIVTKEYLKLIQKDKPSHVFFTHQRPAYLAPFLYAVIKSKIPVSTFIFSWDNLASKGRMLGTFDYFLVWSQLMKNELLYFYPNTKEKNVHIVGTPQFEPYVLDKFKSSKQDFFKQFGLDSNKKTICFSCADSAIGKNDPLVIRTIVEAIRNNEIQCDVQLLVRTSPAEDGSRFKEIREEFPEVMWNIPKWVLTRENHQENWSQRIPSLQDIIDLRSLLENSDLNVNMCSTMSLDFMLFDKPVINTAFGNLENGLYNDQKFLSYDHFKRVVDSGAVVVAKNKTELIQAINLELKKPDERFVQRKEMINIQVSAPLKGTSKRIADFFNNIT